jgi:hypothetical protein
MIVLPLLLASLALGHADETAQATPSLRDGRNLDTIVKPNLLFIVADQQRFDAIRFIQDEMEEYVDKLKILTPNIDRLAERGVHFRKTYCHSPICGPSHATLRSGCTIERTGVQTDSLDENTQFVKKHKALETYDQLLMELGYSAESYGYHLPPQFYKAHSSDAYVITYDDYDFGNKQPELTMREPDYIYQTRLAGLMSPTSIEDMNQTLSSTGLQVDPYTQFPYKPIPLDSSQTLDGSGVAYGTSSLPSSYTPTAMVGEMGLQALERLGRQGTPFCLTVSFDNMDPSMVATLEHFEYYIKSRAEIHVSDSITDLLEGSAYKEQSKLDQGFGDTALVQEWTAVYYALITEMDEWIGKFLDEIDARGATSNTLVVFTADHGEMLGAHAMRGKVSDQLVACVCKKLDLISFCRAIFWKKLFEFP